MLKKILECKYKSRILRKARTQKSYNKDEFFSNNRHLLVARLFSTSLLHINAYTCIYILANNCHVQFKRL